MSDEGSRALRRTRGGEKPEQQGGVQRLLLSIHDVAPIFESEVDRLRDLLAPHAPERSVALLVVPDHWAGGPILSGSGFAARLRAWSDRGAEIFLHGWSHRDDTAHATTLARFKAARLTAGEGEFSGLDRAAALARMRDGCDLLEDITGRAVAGFVAPAWLYSLGARIALIEGGFAMAEDHWRVWSPGDDRVLARGPVLTWASRSAARIAASLAAARVLTPLLGRLPTARVGVHPGDVRVPALLRSIDRSVGELTRTHHPASYRDLLAA